MNELIEMIKVKRELKELGIDSNVEVGDMFSGMDQLLGELKYRCHHKFVNVKGGIVNVTYNFKIEPSEYTYNGVTYKHTICKLKELDLMNMMLKKSLIRLEKI